MSWIIKTRDGCEAQIALADPALAINGTMLPDTLTQTPRVGKPHESWDWEAGCWVEDLAAMIATTCASIDYRRDRLLAQLRPQITDDRRREYDAKAREAYDPAGPWPFMEDEAARLGVSIDEVRDSIKLQVVSQAGREAPIAGIARQAKVAIRAATSCDEIHEIYSAIQWPNTEGE